MTFAAAVEEMLKGKAIYLSSNWVDDGAVKIIDGRFYTTSCRNSGKRSSWIIAPSLCGNYLGNKATAREDLIVFNPDEVEIRKKIDELKKKSDQYLKEAQELEQML